MRADRMPAGRTTAPRRRRRPPPASPRARSRPSARRRPTGSARTRRRAPTEMRGRRRPSRRLAPAAAGAGARRSRSLRRARPRARRGSRCGNETSRADRLMAAARITSTVPSKSGSPVRLSMLRMSTWMREPAGAALAAAEGAEGVLVTSTVRPRHATTPAATAPASATPPIATRDDALRPPRAASGRFVLDDRRSRRLARAGGGQRRQALRGRRKRRGHVAVLADDHASEERDERVPTGRLQGRGRARLDERVAHRAGVRPPLRLVERERPVDDLGDGRGSRRGDAREGSGRRRGRGDDDLGRDLARVDGLPREHREERRARSPDVGLRVDLGWTARAPARAP